MVDLRDVLNQSCADAGLCPDEAPRVKQSAELWREGSKNKILISCLNDGTITSCLLKEDGERCCFSSEKGNEELYENWRGLLTSPEVGYQIKVIDIEEGGASED